MPATTVAPTTEVVDELLDAVYGDRVILDPQEFADLVGLTRQSIYNHAKAGRLDLVPVGTLKLAITRAAARRWLMREYEAQS